MVTQLQETLSFSTRVIPGLLLAVLLVVGCDQVGTALKTGPDRGDPTEKTPTDPTPTRQTQKSFTATQVVKAVIPGARRITGNVLHIRGQKASGFFRGDIVGTFTSEWDMDLVERPNQDLLRSGPARAEFTLTLRSMFREKARGVFEGKASGFVEIGPQGPVNNGEFQAKGTGDFAGMHMRGTYTQTKGAPPTFRVEGMVRTR